MFSSIRDVTRKRLAGPLRAAAVSSDVKTIGGFCMARGVGPERRQPLRIGVRPCTPRASPNSGRFKTSQTHPTPTQGID